MQTGKAIRRILLAGVMFCPGFSTLHAELARIGMVHFTGNVESAGYLGGSLSSAIDDSLKKKFSYQRISEDKIRAALEELSKIGIFDPRKVPEKNNLLRIAVSLKADILIYGSYGIIEKPGRMPGQPVPENEVTQISMRTYVYYVNENRTAELPELKPNLDVSLFEAINTSAENVVAEFKKITVETESDEEVTGSIQTAGTLRMAWLPVVPEESKNKTAVKLYEKIADGIREEGQGIRISVRSVKRHAAATSWGGALAAGLDKNPQYLAEAAVALRSDLVFWPHIENEAKKKYLVISAYHAPMNRILFSVREELKAASDARAEKIQGEILTRLKNYDFGVAAQIAGLKGTGLVLDFGGAEFALNPGEATKDFGKRFKTGESYALTVKKNPREPRQVCHVRNGSDKVTFKDAEILITCITETVPVTVKITDFHGDELLLSLDGKEEMKINGLGEKKFQTRIEDQQQFELSILSLPKLPAQSCKIGEPSKLGDAATIDVKVRCSKAIEHQISGYLGYPAMGSLGAGSNTVKVDGDFPVGKMSSFLAVSAVYQVKNLLPYNFLLGVQTNFSFASAELPVEMFSGETSTGTIKTNMLRVDLTVFTAYPVPLPYRLELLPYAGFGYSYQNLSRSGGNTLSSGFTPLLSLGAILQYDFRPSIKLLFKTGPDLYFYSGGSNLMIWNFSFGVGKQFL